MRTDTETHEGKQLETMLNNLGVKKQTLAHMMKKHINTITLWVNKDKLKSDLLIDIGKALRYDITVDFPRLKKIPEAIEVFGANDYLNEPIGSYMNRSSELSELRLETKFLRQQVEQIKNIVDSKEEIINLYKQRIHLLENQIENMHRSNTDESDLTKNKGK